MQNINQILNDNTVFNLVELRYFPVKKHQPMLVRPYIFNVEQEAVSTLMNRMDETKTGRITPGILKGVTGGIVKPSGVGYETAIDATWVSTRRFLFMMKVNHISLDGTETNTYLIGYTEYDGIAPNGHIDMNMPHYINNVIETTVYYYQTPLGTQRVEKLLKTYDAIYSVSNHHVYTQRPVDLYQAVNAQDMAMFGGFAEVQFENPASTVNPFTNNVVSSTSENNITTEYLSKILTSGMHAVKAREIHVNSYSMGSDDPSEKFFTEPSVSETQFVRHLSRICGFKGVRPVFNMGNLMTIDPTIYSRFKMYNVTDEIRDPIMMATPEVGDHWNGTDAVTVKAYSLIENCVSLANKYGFTKLSFKSTNMDNPLQICSTGILSFHSFLSVSEADMNYLLEIFKEKFHIEIFLNETNSGRTPLFMECHINIHGTSKIYLEYSGFQGNWYTIPTFAGSSFAPVLTFDQNAVDYSATQLNNVLNTLVQAQQPGTY